MLTGLLAICVAAPAGADTPSLMPSLAPVSYPVGNAALTLAGLAAGALFTSGGGSGLVQARPQLRRDYDSGLALSLEGTATLADPLSRGRYDGDVIERLAGVARTGLGRFEIGIADGAAYDIAVTGPKVDTAVSLEDPRTTFFRDPTTHRAVTEMFASRTAVGASRNLAKFNYVSPPLLGVTLALSFTPTQAKELPFLNAGPHVAGRQADIWEAALRYETDIDTGWGPVALSAYGAAAEGRGEHKLPGQEGVSDLGAGVRAAYALTDALGISLGGSFRQSNAYGFDINRSYRPATTRAGHISARIQGESWRAGIEIVTGVAGAVPNVAQDLPQLDLNGIEASLGFSLSPSLDVSTGWQRLNYQRSSGQFFNGAPRLGMDAVYLHVTLQTAE